MRARGPRLDDQPRLAGLRHPRLADPLRDPGGAARADDAGLLALVLHAARGDHLFKSPFQITFSKNSFFKLHTVNAT